MDTGSNNSNRVNPATRLMRIPPPSKSYDVTGASLGTSQSVGEVCRDLCQITPQVDKYILHPLVMMPSKLGVTVRPVSAG